MNSPTSGIVAALRASIAGVVAYLFARVAAALFMAMLEYVIFRGEFWALFLLIPLAGAMALVVLALQILAESLVSAVNWRR